MIKKYFETNNSFFNVKKANKYHIGQLISKREKEQEIIEMLNDLEAKATKTDIVS